MKGTHYFLTPCRSIFLAVVPTVTTLTTRMIITIIVAMSTKEEVIEITKSTESLIGETTVIPYHLGNTYKMEAGGTNNTGDSLNIFHVKLPTQRNLQEPNPVRSMKHSSRKKTPTVIMKYV